jgi:hypothetical protein
VFFTVTFRDPKDVYKATRNIIEVAAAELKLKLHRLRKEVVSPSGRAKYARSSNIRRVYRGLVKRAKEAEKRRVTSRGGFALFVDPRSEDTEILVDKEDHTLPSRNHAQHPRTTSSSMPALAFRVFDESSGTAFNRHQGFVAGAVRSWKGSISPFRLEDSEGRRMILMTCNAHFSKEKVPSYCRFHQIIVGYRSDLPPPGISVFTSLLESLVKAAQMVRPSLAVIDLNHPSLQEPGKLLSAANILQDLKKKGQAQWARTKHLAEMLVWCELPLAAIICCMSLSDLIGLTDKHHVVREMLQLHEFQTSRRTSMVASFLARKKVTLDSFSARAMALVCKEFNLSSPRHISDLVAHLIDGWSITVDGILRFEQSQLRFRVGFERSRSHTFIPEFGSRLRHRLQ